MNLIAPSPQLDSSFAVRVAGEHLRAVKIACQIVSVCSSRKVNCARTLFFLFFYSLPLVTRAQLTTLYIEEIIIWRCSLRRRGAAPVLFVHGLLYSSCYYIQSARRRSNPPAGLLRSLASSALPRLAKHFLCTRRRETVLSFSFLGSELHRPDDDGAGSY